MWLISIFVNEKYKSVTFDLDKIQELKIQAVLSVTKLT